MLTLGHWVGPGAKRVEVWAANNQLVCFCLAIMNCGCVCKAKRILETLRADNETLASNLLQQRLKLCEHALVMSTSNLLSVSAQALNTSVESTSSLWPKYPLSIQVTLSERFALDAFGKSVDLAKTEKRRERWEPALKEFLKHFEWTQRTDYPSSLEVKKFNGSNTRFGDTLDLVLSLAGEARDDNLLASFDTDAAMGATQAEESRHKQGAQASVATRLIGSHLLGLFLVVPCHERPLMDCDCGLKSS